MKAHRRGLTRRELALLVAVLAGLFLLIQFLPLGAQRSNPPVVAEPAWDSPRTRELFLRTCGDCHSNQTRWPWYSYVAPASWLVTSDVTEARKHLNVSEWHREQEDADEAAEEFREGEMPLPIYLPLHPEARLDPDERKELLRGLLATFGERRSETERD